MPVANEHRGPFVQITHVLRFTKDQPPRSDTESARPRKGRKGDWREFLDDPDAPHGATPGPTLVTFAADDAVDVPKLLRQGALREPRPDQLPPKRQPRRTVGDEVVDGPTAE